MIFKTVFDEKFEFYYSYKSRLLEFLGFIGLSELVAKNRDGWLFNYFFVSKLELLSESRVEEIQLGKFD